MLGEEQQQFPTSRAGSPASLRALEQGLERPVARSSTGKETPSSRSGCLQGQLSVRAQEPHASPAEHHGESGLHGRNVPGEGNLLLLHRPLRATNSHCSIAELHYGMLGNNRSPELGRWFKKTRHKQRSFLWSSSSPWTEL